MTESNSTLDRTKLIGLKEAADYIGITKGALLLLANKENGPKYIKVGRRYKFTLDGLDTWKDAAFAK